MSKESEFKSWLEQGGAQTAKGRNSRAYAIRTIERNLEELGIAVPGPGRSLGKRTGSIR